MLISRSVKVSRLPKSRPIQLYRACTRHVWSEASTQTSWDAPPAQARSNSKVYEPKVNLTWPPSSTFASYTVGLAPTLAQLRYADRYFETGNPTFLSSAAKFRTIPVSNVPEVAFLGRSNVGKSSLLNALLHRTSAKIANVSKKPGRTRLINAFGIGGVETSRDGNGRDTWHGRGGLVLMDMPGYGKGSQTEWGTEIIKYLTGRQQLRRIFLLVDSEHGLKTGDEQILQLLWSNQLPYQVILTKVDKKIMPRQTDTLESVASRLHKLPDIFAKGRVGSGHPNDKARGIAHDVLSCSSEISMPPTSKNKIGIDNLRWAVLCAAGLESDQLGKPRQIQLDMQPSETIE